jgi:hypothetical protein
MSITRVLSSPSGNVLGAAVDALTTRPWVRLVAQTCYYLIIIAGLIAMYGKGDFSTPSFIYQNF